MPIYFHAYALQIPGYSVSQNLKKFLDDGGELSTIRPIKLKNPSKSLVHPTTFKLCLATFKSSDLRQAEFKGMEDKT